VIADATAAGAPRSSAAGEVHAPDGKQSDYDNGSQGMQILIRTDHNIEGREAMVAETTAFVTHALRHFSERITRLEVHLADENGPKGGDDDIRCTLEARLEGRQPIAVTHHAGTILLAVHGAANSLVALIESTLGRTEALQRAQRT
jgi:hypothetical protein